MKGTNKNNAASDRARISEENDNNVQQRAPNPPKQFPSMSLSLIKKYSVRSYSQTNQNNSFFLGSSKKRLVCKVYSPPSPSGSLNMKIMKSISFFWQISCAILLIPGSWTSAASSTCGKPRRRTKKPAFIILKRIGGLLFIWR